MRLITSATKTVSINNRKKCRNYRRSKSSTFSFHVGGQLPNWLAAILKWDPESGKQPSPLWRKIRDAANILFVEFDWYDDVLPKKLKKGYSLQQLKLGNTLYLFLFTYVWRAWKKSADQKVPQEIPREKWNNFDPDTCCSQWIENSSLYDH